MYNCGLLKFLDIEDDKGNLTPIESKTDIPFDIKRIYYISNVKEDAIRGFHAHRKLHQVLVCVKGSVKIKTVTPKDEKMYILDNACVGLYIGTYIWREMFDFSEDAVLLVLASEHYDENDYIRNIDLYMQEAKKRF